MTASVELAARKRRFSINVVAALVAGAVLWWLPSSSLQPSTLRLYGLTLLFAVAVMGLNLVFGMAGQVTLGPAGVFAVGAYTTGLLAGRHGWHPLAAIGVGILAAAVAGAVIGLPALRVGGFYLAMVTAYAAISVPAAVTVFPKQTGGEDGLLVPPLKVGSEALTDDGAFRFIVIVVLVSAFLVGNVARSSWGRWFRCLAVSPVGTSALGISVYRGRVYSFLLSAVFGGLAGGVYAHYQLIITPFTFGFDLSLALFAAAVIGGLGTLWGPVLGAAFYFLGPRYILPGHWGAGWTQVFYGALLIVLMILIPRGLVEAIRDVVRLGLRVTGLQRGGTHAAKPEAGKVAERTREALPPLLERAGAHEEAARVLVASGVSKRFGGVRALEEASVEVVAGRITALIGPNGSGKTTLLNVCSGFLRADAGRVEIAGVDVSGMPPHARSSLGLARTFQQPIVFRALNGAQNVMAGYARNRPDPLSAMFSLPRSTRHEREAALRAEALLDALGVPHLSQRSAAHATLAEARILDLARALALDPVVLLLDEPAAGLDLDEIAVLEAMVRAAREAGIGVLLVEHDVGFVTRLADHVTVLDRGRVIANGPPDEIRNDRAVKAAYFGEVELEEAVVG